MEIDKYSFNREAWMDPFDTIHIAECIRIESPGGSIISIPVEVMEKFCTLTTGRRLVYGYQNGNKLIVPNCPYCKNTHVHTVEVVEIVQQLECPIIRLAPCYDKEYIITICEKKEEENE